MKQQFVVSEYSDDIFIPNYELTQEERLYLVKSSIIHEKRPWEKRFYFDELKNGLRLQTQSWVGVIELEKARIVIQPKFNKGFTALLEMISFIEELPFYQWQDTDGAIGKTDLLEILVRVFLKEAERVLKIGLVKEYITEAENLVNLRGRVEFRQNLKQNYNLPNKVYCEYDELVTNIVDNQILLSVLSKISTYRLSTKTKQKLNMIRSQIELLCDEYKDTVWPTFNYNRLNTHYERAHKIGHHLWKGLSATSFLDNQNSFYSFLIDMNDLFEKFVVKLLTKYLPPVFKVIPGKRITNGITMDGQSYRHIIPDILVENKTTNEISILDVKYKHYGKRRVDTSDVFQLAFYAQNKNSQSKDVYISTIVYPSFADDRLMDINKINLNIYSNYPGAMYLKPISIEKILESIKCRDTKILRELIKSLIK
ncbi:McrC family protein [Fictibacillus arsenicus]|uniref:Restriction endonuclease n=1 Tax=Fictibacillus arsenicus TaxID=255247 RepID=A0A1V3G7S9_9BACL|nr:hypothetical protein [Fictibacillus arsenicus]OOE12488.1 hypothetical protein UN64_10405 [Fictibacillus arsenicus]